MLILVESNNLQGQELKNNFQSWARFKTWKNLNMMEIYNMEIWFYKNFFLFCYVAAYYSANLPPMTDCKLLFCEFSETNVKWFPFSLVIIV